MARAERRSNLPSAERHSRYPAEQTNEFPPSHGSGTHTCRQANSVTAHNCGTWCYIAKDRFSLGSRLRENDLGSPMSPTHAPRIRTKGAIFSDGPEEAKPQNPRPQ